MFIEDCNHCYFYLLGGSGCQNLWLCPVMGIHASNWRRHVITLIFNLLTSKWGHGSPVSWASLLPIFSLLCPSVLNTGWGTGQRCRTMLMSQKYCCILWRYAGFYNSLLKKTDYRFYHFIIKWQHGKNNRTQYPKTKQPRKTKLFNLNTTQDQPHNHPLARPVQKRNKLSNVTQHMVHLDTCGTPSEWRWTWQILKNMKCCVHSISQIC